MAHTDEGFKALPAYGARASVMQILGDEPITAATRSDIVLRSHGPLEVPIHFRRDGIAIFEFDQVAEFAGGSVDPFVVDDTGNTPKAAELQMRAREALQEKRFRYMNACLTCFHVAANVSNKITAPSSRSSYIWARFEHGSWALMDNGAGLIKPLPFALNVHVDKLQECATAFKRIEGDDFDDSLNTLDLLYRASFNLNHHEYQTVLVIGWAVIEACQELLWKRMVAGGYKRFNPSSEITGKRKKLLLTDRNFTASIKGQILALVGEYQDSELELIDRVRKKRNDFMHSLDSVTEHDAFEAMWACGIVASKSLGLKVTPFGNPSGWDYKR